LSTSATGVVFVAVLVPVVVVSFAPLAALPLAGVSVVVIASVMVRIGGISVADVVMRRVRFHRARAAGWTELSAGVLTDHPRAADLPGVLAPVVPLDVDDGRGSRHALLHNRVTGTLSAVLRCSPVGLELADTGQADQWVANWGGLLADLGHHRLVRHLSVTIDTAPSGGATTRDHVTRRIDPGAPALARRVLEELVAQSPATAADIDARLTVCLDPDRATPRPVDLLAAAVEVGRRLPGIEAALGGCGIAVRERATTAWLLGRLRVAFDPHTRPDLDTDTGRDSAAGRGLRELAVWAEAGPVAARELWDRYQHDGAVSVTWALRDAPRQAVGHTVLAPLLAPGVFPRRVTWLYHPYPADQAASKVESEVTAGLIRRAWAARTRRDETQRDRDDRARAVQSAREEALGAGVGRFTLYVTTTVTDPDDVAAAVADVEHRAGAAKLRLRRLRGSQAAGFAAALGVGVDPVDLLIHRGRH
jgi:hypothetical protein